MNTIISIVITSYTTRQMKDIQALLDSVKTQSYPNIETIFVAERSPELYTLVKTNQQQVRNLKVIYNKGIPGMSASRNLGVKQSKGQIIAFIDDDAVLSSQWAEETVRAYDSDAGIIGLTGPIVPLWEEPSMAWFPREFYWLFSCTYYDWTNLTEVRNGYGTNISFRREIFDKGLFFSTKLGSVGSKNGGEFKNQKTTGEETELSLRVKQLTGKRIMYNPKIIVNHKVQKFRLTKEYIWKRAYIEGASKMNMRKVFMASVKGENLQKTEYDLLRRIVVKLFPDILKGFFNDPVTACRKFYITTIVLTAVAAGYFSCLFKKNPVQVKFYSSNGS